MIDANGELCDEGCLAIFGPHITENTVPTVEAITERCKVPALSVTGSDESLGERFFAFPQGSLTDEPIFWADLLAKGGHSDVGVLKEETLVGETYLKNFRRACKHNNIRTVAEESIAQTAHDVSTAVKALYEPKVPAIVHCGFGFGLLHVSPALKALGWNPSRFCGTTFQNAWINPALWDAFMGWVGVDQYDEGNRVGQQFLDDYHVEYGRRPEWCVPVVNRDVACTLLRALADAHPLSPRGVNPVLERVKMLPAASGAPGTRVSFGKWTRRGWMGAGYLVARRLDADGVNSHLVDRFAADQATYAISNAATCTHFLLKSWSKMTELRFDDRVVVVTGAGRGVGRSHAKLLASKGARVVVADYGGGINGDGASAQPADKVAEEIRVDGGDAVACFASVAEERSAASIVATAVDTYGRIDAVINNAGIHDPGDFDQLSVDQFRRMLDVHYFGTLFVIRAAWPHFTLAGYGRVVNTVSEAALGGALPRNASYAAAKGAVFGLTRSLAVEGASHGIRVNAVAPRAFTRLSASQSQEIASVRHHSEEAMRGIEASMPPEMCAPGAAYLAHETCELNGEVLRVGLGGVARIAVVHSHGLSAKSVTAEDIRDHIAQITDLGDARIAEAVRTP